jgi:flavin reductase (DIM6/NTAB) family NADH-FMN oxidoreductase RutF
MTQRAKMPSEILRILIGSNRMSKINIGSRVTPYPMPVTLVGTLVDNRVNFMTAAWIGRMNYEPPIWSAGINKRHHTVKGIKENEAFSINFPSSDMIEKIDYCGLCSGKKIDKSQVFDIYYGELKNTPMIQDCPLAIECKLYKIVEMPTNLLILGEVVASYTEVKYLTDGKIDIKKLNPPVLTMPDNRYWTVGDYLADAWKIGKSYNC